MNTAKQKLLLEYSISSPDVFALCSSILKAEYFDPELRLAVDFIHEYYDEYNTVPDTEQIIAETDVLLKYHDDLTKDKIDYCSQEIEKFCKRRAIEEAVLASPALIEKGDYGKIEEVLKEALTTSLHKNLGIDFFEDVRSRLESRQTEDLFYSSGWDEFDEMIGGGYARKTITLFSANSGGGKSITLSNAGISLMKQGLHVLYLSLELYQDMVDDRYIQMFSGINRTDFGQRISEIEQKVGRETTDGTLTIKYMPAGSNANDFRAFLKEFELKKGFVPDVLIVDYLDIMGSNEKMSADNVFEKDKRSTEQLRNILVDYNMIGLTASQQNRGAIEAADQNRLNQSHIAGGISKVNTVDVHVSIIMNDVMRAKGEMAMQFLKTRSSDGVGNTIYLCWHRDSLRITNQDRSSTSKPALQLPSNDNNNTSDRNNSLLDLMDIS